MIAMGDAFMGWNGIIQDGGWSVARRYSATEKVGSTQRALKRHDGRMNLAFCDGHVETLPVLELFAGQKPEYLRLWNRDNQPHFERLR